MNNLTKYADSYLLDLMEQCNINPHKATVNLQLHEEECSKYVEYLNIWLELPNQFGWDEVHQLVYSERKDSVDFRDEMCITNIIELEAMVEYYSYVLPEYILEEEFNAYCEYCVEAMSDPDYWAELYADYQYQQEP